MDAKRFQKCDVQYVTLVKKCGANEEGSLKGKFGPDEKEDDGPSTQQTARLALDVAFRVLRCADRDTSGLMDLGVPSQITLETTADLNELVKFLGVAKFFDNQMITDVQDAFLFNNLRDIMVLCNDRMQDFVKKRCNTVEKVLKFFEDVGDDGDYKWIPLGLIRPLFVWFKRGDEKVAAAMHRMTPQFLVFLFKHPQVVIRLKDNQFLYVVAEKRANHTVCSFPLKRPRTTT